VYARVGCCVGHVCLPCHHMLEYPSQVCCVAYISLCCSFALVSLIRTQLIRTLLVCTCVAYSYSAYSTLLVCTCVAYLYFVFAAFSVAPFSFLVLAKPMFPAKTAISIIKNIHSIFQFLHVFVKPILYLDQAAYYNHQLLPPMRSIDQRHHSRIINLYHHRV